MITRRGLNFLVGGTIVLIVGVALFMGIRMLAQAETSPSTGKVVEVQPAIDEPRDTRKAVKICRMFPVQMDDIQALPGSVRAFEDVNMSSKTSGVIQEIYFEEGDRVTKGDKLLQLDVDDLKAVYNQALAQLELAEKRYKRLQNLLRDKVVSKEEFDGAEAELLRLKAALQTAKVNRDRGTVFAPISGIIDRRPVDVGEYINPGDQIAKLVNIDRVKVVINVPEKDITYYRTGDPVRLECRLSRDEITSFTGSIDFVAVTANDASRTYPVKIVVDNPEGELRPGMIIDNVFLTRRKNDRALAVPFFSILNREEGKTVFVEEKGAAREIRVEMGIIRNGLVEITTGLEEGDHLIVVGQRELVDGEKVRVAQDVTDVAKEMIRKGGDPSKLALQVLN